VDVNTYFDGQYATMRLYNSSAPSLIICEYHVQTYNASMAHYITKQTGYIRKWKQRSVQSNPMLCVYYVRLR
jgi:hypothetical protein